MIDVSDYDILTLAKFLYPYNHCFTLYLPFFFTNTKVKFISIIIILS